MASVQVRVDGLAGFVAVSVVGQERVGFFVQQFPFNRQAAKQAQDVDKVIRAYLFVSTAKFLFDRAPLLDDCSGLFFLRSCLKT